MVVIGRLRAEAVEAVREAGRERRQRHLEADLVVALSGASVGDRRRSGLVGDLDQHLRDQRSRQRGHQRITALVQSVHAESREHVTGHEPLASIDEPSVYGTEIRGARHGRGQVSRLAHVDGGRYDFVTLLGQPPDGDRRVQTARVRQHDLLHVRASLSPALSGAEVSCDHLCASAAAAPGSAVATKIVSSPAIVPATSASSARSIARATALA